MTVTLHAKLTTLFMGLTLALPVNAAEIKVDHRIWNDLLVRHVKNGVVDYKGFQKDSDKLDQYLTDLSHIKPKELDHNEKFAFYINAYNAWTIHLILTRYPDLTSIKDLAIWPWSPWKKKICNIDGQQISLDTIEHEILRPEFNDPRVHFAINCASKGCPRLIPEAYQANRLDEMLDRVTRAFINRPERNYLKDGTLYVSKIFKWFGEDFNEDIVGFFQKYAQGDLLTAIKRQKGSLHVKYLSYDWSLNGN